MSGDVEVLKAEVDRLRRELRATEQRLEAAQIVAADFAVGDELEFRNRSGEWESGIVREVEPGSSWVWYVVSRRKKSGEWATATQRAFAVQPVDPPEARA